MHWARIYQRATSMSLVLQDPKPEADPQFNRVLDQKLTAVPIPKALWLFMFSEHGRQVWEETKWQFGGDPNRQIAPAADPETSEDGFINRMHSFYTDEGLLIVRRRDVPDPRAASGDDFMVIYTNLEGGEPRSLSVAEYEHNYEDYAHTLPRDIYDLGDALTSSGDLVVSPRARRAPFGALNVNGMQAQTLLGDLYELDEKAKQVNNYYSHAELGHIANMYEVVPTPATMAA